MEASVSFLSFLLLLEGLLFYKLITQPGEPYDACLLRCCCPWTNAGISELYDGIRI